jgi:hypothetical protein
MQLAFLLSPQGVTKRSTKQTPVFVEVKKNYKICALLKGSVNGNKENGSTKRRTRATRPTQA